MPRQDKVLVVPICKERTFLTKAQTAGNEAVYRLAAGPAEAIGPYMEKLRVAWEGMEFSTNFSAKVRMSYSVTGTNWSTPVDILSTQSADGQTIGSFYSTDTEFGPKLRFELVCWNGSGSAVESAKISANLEIVLRS